MHKLVVVFMGLLLVSGLALAACTTTETVTPPQPSESEEPAATSSEPGQPAVEAKTYTNSEYGFSVQYPTEWEERTELINDTVVAAFGIPAFVPGMSISVADADAPLTADWIVAQTNSLPDTSSGEVTSEIEPTTLDDGTEAFQYTLEYKYQVYDIKAFGVAADKDGKRIRAFVWTIDAVSPYDEATFSEIAHTLSFE